MISIYTFFFSAFLFLWVFLCVSLPLCLPVIPSLSSHLSLCLCCVVQLLLQDWKADFSSVDEVVGWGGGGDGHIEIGNGCRVWPACRHAFRLLTYETPSPTHLFVSELKRREPSVWHDAENLTAGIKVALLLLRLRASVLYSVPDWRHFQWC